MDTPRKPAGRRAALGPIAILLRTVAFAVLAVGAAATLACSMPVSAAAGSSSSADTPAGRAVRALLDDAPREALTRVPADFSRSTGYEPVLRDRMAVNPAGACSSPVPLPDRFTPACMAHDLGYDLLRYAESHGTPLGAWARRGLDAQFADRMHASCTPADAGCVAAADTATTAVRLNSWRQDYGAPLDESVLLYAVGGVGTAGAVAAAGTGLTAVLRSARRIRATAPARRTAEAAA